MMASVLPSGLFRYLNLSLTLQPLNKYLTEAYSENDRTLFGLFICDEVEGGPHSLEVPLYVYHVYLPW